MNVKKRIRLHFEDKGQDFLCWDIEYWTANDLFGLVVDCGPFQAQTCHDFGHVEFGKRDKEGDLDTRRLNYEIEKMEELPATPEKIAKALMKEIQYDNGMVNRWEPEQYPKKWVELIAIPAEVFFNAHPYFLGKEHLSEIASGCQEEKEDKYGRYSEYQALDDVLNDYFDSPDQYLEKRIKSQTEAND